MVKKVLTLFRVLIVRLSSPLLFYKTQGWRGEPRVWKLWSRQKMRPPCSLMQEIHWECSATCTRQQNAFYYIFPIILSCCLPSFSSCYLLSLVSSTSVGNSSAAPCKTAWKSVLFQCAGDQRKEAAVAWNRVISNAVSYIGLITARCPMCLKWIWGLLWLATFEIKFWVRKTKLRLTIINFWWDFYSVLGAANGGGLCSKLRTGGYHKLDIGR